MWPPENGCPKNSIYDKDTSFIRTLCESYAFVMFPFTQDPDYTVEMDQDNPEFKKLAFTAPGPKNAFAPLKRSDYLGKRKISLSYDEDGCGEHLLECIEKPKTFK